MKYFLLADTRQKFIFYSIYLFSLQFLLSLGLVCHLVSGEASRQTRQRQDEDESIQGFVFERAKRLGYGLRIIPRVREILFGRTAPPSKIVREKRKLRDHRRPNRLLPTQVSLRLGCEQCFDHLLISQVGGAKLKSSPRN